MSIASSLYAILQLNTAGANNTGSPLDAYNGTAISGVNFSGVTQLNVTGATSIPSIQSSWSVAALMVRNTGTNPVVLDMKNQAGNSSQITINAGGAFYMFNTATSNASNQSLVSSWTLTSVSGTTVLVAWVS